MVTSPVRFGQIWQKNLSAKNWSTDFHRQPTIFLPLDFFAMPFVLTGTTRGGTTKDAKDTKERETTTASLEEFVSLVATIVGDSGDSPFAFFIFASFASFVVPPLF